MTRQEAREELRSYRKLVDIMQNRSIRIEQLRTRLYSMKGVMFKDLPKGNSNKYYIEELMDKLAKAEREYSDAVWDAESKAKKIIRKLERLPPTYYKVLHKIFIEGKSYRWAAAELHYGITSIGNIVKRGIAKYEKL